jgi:signal peptidase
MAARSVYVLGMGCMLIGAATLVVPLRNRLGLRAFVILSPSMRPVLKEGSLIIVRDRPPASYRKGDIITYRQPNRVSVFITHRIVRLGTTSTGVPIALTKGDANTNGDPWKVAVGDIVGKEVLALPYVGYAINEVQTAFGFLVCTVILFLAVVLPAIRSAAGAERN